MGRSSGMQIKVVRSLNPSPKVSLEEAFFVRMRAVRVEDLKEKLPSASDDWTFRTRFLPNHNFMDYPLLAVENVCMEPTGTLLLVNISAEEVEGKCAEIPELHHAWTDIYAGCGVTGTQACTGVRYTDRLPQQHSWVGGNTLHFLGYVGNSMHNWAERIWPNLAAHLSPFNETTPKPIHHFLIHRFDQLLKESQHTDDRKQLLWQARMLIELFPGADYLRVEDQIQPACFERFLLQMHDNDRIDQTRLPPKMYKEIIRNFRATVFAFFNLPLPQVRLPPKPLRVLYYGRHDTERRRVRNTNEVLAYLRSFSQPTLEVRSLDEMLANGQTSYNFPNVVSLYSQTDILVVAHGANTWATFCLPEGAGVIEVFGPCNWSINNFADIRKMYTWMHVNAVSLRLKHDISNPFGKSIPNVKRGNTTLCGDPFEAVPDYTIDTLGVGRALASFGHPQWPGDLLSMHWFHDWVPH